MKIEVQCPHCGVIYEPKLAQRPTFAEEFIHWQLGNYIQDIWPEASPIEREQIMTGFCSDECWQAAFPEDPEDGEHRPAVYDSEEELREANEDDNED